MNTVLSFGAGVNSTAILALVANGKYPLPNLIVFADTGAENPKTYCHIQAMKNLFPIQIVRREQNLYDFCIEKKVIPSRMLRWCTDKWKIRPIREFVSQEATYIFGFAKGEENRAKNAEAEYPLIDRCIDRNGCINIIKEVGWEVPPKSGCFFCPFQHKLEWLALRENQPPLWKKAIELEQNALQRYDKMFLYGDRPLEELDSSQTRLLPLSSYQHCFCSDGAREELA